MAVKKKPTKRVSAKAQKLKLKPKLKKSGTAKRASARKAPARAAKSVRKPARKIAKKPARSAKAAKSKPVARKAKTPVEAPAAARKSAALPRAKAKPPAAKPAVPRHETAAMQARDSAAADAEAAESGAAETRLHTHNGRLPRALRHQADIDEPRETAGAPERSFIDPENPDDLAEELGEEYVKAVTSGEPSLQETRDQVLPEESGGPFIETSPNTEFAGGTDESNPIDAEQEPFPTANQTTRK